MNFSVIIPARYGSTRFPGKPLALINNKSMIQHVFERAQESGAKQIIVATDDQRIADACHSFGAQVCMTADDHESGTSRLAEVIAKENIDKKQIVVNVQGDEPFIPAENIIQVAKNLAENPHVPMGTLAQVITDVDDILNPNIVKVVTNAKNLAMYFSRAVIPFDRNAMLSNDLTELSLEDLPGEYLRHIGIYGYRAGFVSQYNKLASTQLESIESLEQLRVLWHGYNIHVDVAAKTPPHGVDTPEDLARLMAAS
ncbi:3-deoxy-manno-octulosonate cytidylyltransferase [Glaciecola sp. KUL10]|uniref:3-deoxy-manno-octulosonate cytidylyltransferase n=1 Tax=Glaciecola sp. (strain KUL10) TaxID=2161813 RepID=UPI000D7851B6|nr:3-deoxy-manno-octulosonate cytidylyltransferase [Glaciecola sp. KUL10]GBL03263.1 3-deoxy-D-manno-octulosonate cytidylyltransferase [Glaciecola sp. KUL10]